MTIRDGLEVLYLVLSIASIITSAYAAHHAKAAHESVNGGADSIKPAIDTMAAEVHTVIESLPKDDAAPAQP